MLQSTTCGKMNSGIYCIKNKISGKVYIGSSKNILSRWRQHKYKLRLEIHENSYLQRSWVKYGDSVFIFSVIEYCDEKDLDNKELFWINKLNSLDRDFGYNIRPDIGCRIFTEEHRNNISKALKKYYKDNSHHCLGKVLSSEVKRKISKSNKGKQRSKETKKRISLCNKNRGREWREKLSISHMGHTQSELTKKKIGLASKKTWNDEKNKSKKHLFCEICGEEYWTHGRRSKYCSNACRTKAYRIRKKNKLNS